MVVDVFLENLSRFCFGSMIDVLFVVYSRFLGCFFLCGYDVFFVVVLLWLDIECGNDVVKMVIL